ncbi:MAG: hypothetical protein AAGJ31_13380, partial [Verrucomicrobiota bacterium]
GFTFRYKKQLSGGRVGSTSLFLPWEKVDHVLYTPLPGEREALEDLSSVSTDRLRDLWLQRLRLLGRPKSSAPALGLEFAKRLSLEEQESSKTRAIEIFQRLETDSWDPSLVPFATQGRLRTLLRMGRFEEAIREAKVMAEDEENAALLLEAKQILASVEFDRLQTLETENPRWHLDDEIRPKRNAHFHKAIDLYLYAYLFQGSDEIAAARGLLGAAEVYRFADDHDQARVCAEDVLRHYSNTPSRDPASQLLKTLNADESP